MSKKVVVHWDAAGLRAEPDEIQVNSRTEDLRWELESTRRGARLGEIRFDGEAGGPFRSVGASSDLLWTGTGSKANDLGRRYKYSIFVSDASGASLELDPYIIDTDKP